MTIIDNISNALTLLEDPVNKLELVKKTQRIKLSPKYQGDLKTGVACHLRCFLSFYNKEFEGVPVAYKNVTVQHRMGKMLYDQPCIQFDVEADFIVFKPSVGCILKGKVNKVAKKHIGCLVHDCFNASLMQTSETENISAVKLMGLEVEFEVLHINSKNKILSIKGNLKRLISKPGATTGRINVHQKKTKGKGKSSKEVNVDTMNETVLAGGGIMNGITNDSLDLYSFEPDSVISSTQTNDSTDKRENSKHKKKSKKKAKDNDESFDVTSGQVNESGDAGDEVTIDEQDSQVVHESSSKKHKKKKKHKSVENDNSDVNGNADKSEVVEIVNETEDEVKTSTKHKKRKRKLEEISSTVEDQSVEQDSELFSPRKKHKSKDRHDSTVDDRQNSEEVQEHSLSKKKKKKHKHGKE